jgi:hypothetical protein
MGVVGAKESQQLESKVANFVSYVGWERKRLDLLEICYMLVGRERD